ncbi:outer membrane protein assembly factor BamB family protein [Micromonospora siamensis]|uniref:PQQ-like domain-containing protein n=1 Tax=Micromonospora siamensis TaxID=299152 RepID=A0A1C5HT82_9ACTN|nr:PQQ-binding-like beta-propeller repeat protein [Micromonospora siamensis]SCG49103.1 PQQ-like domain-containing protein [Micromonospora siamensis]
MIELGELRHGDDDDPRPDPVRAAPPARAGRVLLVLLLVLLTAAGSAPDPVRREYVTLPGPQVSTFELADGRLFVADGPQSMRPTTEVVAYQVPEGRRLWRMPLVRGHRVLGLTVEAGTLLIASSPAGNGQPATTAVDVANGRVRWQRDGYPLFGREGTVLLQAGSGTDPGNLEAVGVTSGRVRWTRPWPTTGTTFEYGDPAGVGRFLQLDRRGRVQVYDARTGDLIVAGPIVPASHGFYDRVDTIGGLLLVEDGSGTVYAYGLDRLDARWRLRLPVEARDGWGYQDCGDVICLVTGESGAQVIDPATGRIRWSTDRADGLFPIGDRLLAGLFTQGQEAELTVLDPATGRRIADLGRWRVAVTDPTREPLFGLHRLKDNRELVAELNVAAGQARVLDVLPGYWDDCATRDRILVCRRLDGTLGVWRLGR